MSLGDPWFYIVMLGIAAILYALFLPGRKGIGQEAGDKTNSHIEEALEQYMEDIASENQQIIDMIATIKQDTVAKQLSQQESISELRQRLGSVELALRQLEASALLSNASGGAEVLSKNDIPDPASGNGVSEKKEEEVEPEISEKETEEANEPSLRSRYPELFELYDRGKSIDAIAKSIGLQRGEVQLILQLADREGAK